MRIPAALPPMDSLWGSLGEAEIAEGGNWGQGGDAAALERRMVSQNGEGYLDRVWEKVFRH